VTRGCKASRLRPGAPFLYFVALSFIIITNMSTENTPSSIPSVAETMAALRASAAVVEATGNAAVDAAISSNNKIVTDNQQGMCQKNADVANAPKPDPDLHRVMLPRRG